LKTLGVEKGNDVDTSEESTSSNDLKYIVNYSTGEIFDIGNGKYYKTEYNLTGDYIYLPGSTGTIDSESYDFNDD
jgi:hypothetical protein